MEKYFKNQKNLLRESISLEFKISAERPAGIPSGDLKEDRRRQLRELAIELAAFSNAGVQGTLAIGLDDHGIPRGFRLGKWSQQDFEADLRNRLGYVLGSRLFVQSLIFTWTTLDTDLYVLQIAVSQPYSEVLWIDGTELYIRSGASATRLTDRDINNFIQIFYS